MSNKTSERLTQLKKEIKELKEQEKIVQKNLKKGKVKALAYLHSGKESMLDLGEEIGLEGEALNTFMYALYEVEFELEVDMSTGEHKILKVNE